jgi:hypothetical protein
MEENFPGKNIVADKFFVLICSLEFWVWYLDEITITFGLLFLKNVLFLSFMKNLLIQLDYLSFISHFSSLAFQYKMMLLKCFDFFEEKVIQNSNHFKICAAPN